MTRVSRRVRAVPASGIRRFFDIINTMEDVISLGVGEPDFVTPLHIRQAGIRSLQEGRTAYTSNFGTLALRRAIAREVEQRYGVAYNPEDQQCEIIVTAGVSEALDLAIRATVDPQDEVIVPEPSYVSYAPCVVFAGGTPVMVPTTAEQGFAITARQVAAAVTPRTKGIMLGYPNNPTGTAVSRAELAAIVRLAVEHDLLLYSDEIYARLVYDGWEHTCVAALPGARERTILLNGFSKSYAMTGWRVGYACAPAEILEAMMKVHQYGLLSAPTTAQDAALEALEHGEPDVQAMLHEYARRREMFVDGAEPHRTRPAPGPRAPSTPSPLSPAAGSPARSSPRGCCSGRRWPSSPGAPSGPAARGTCGCATPRPMRSWRRPSGASSASSIAPLPRGGKTEPQP